MKFRFLLLALVPLVSQAAEDGKVLYETFCSACHGVDGVGPEGNLTSHGYVGKWEVMPDFSKLEPVSVEEEPRNYVDSAHGNRDKEFAVVWEGDLVTAKEGDYTAVLDSSDGAVLYLEGSKIVEVAGVGPRGEERARSRRFRMLEGKNRFRLEYFNNQGNPGLSLLMQGPTGEQYLSESRLEVQPATPPIPIVPPKGGAAIYRHFISGSGERTIAVGYDGGVNATFGITRMGPDLIWQGDFIDGGLHWTNRGTGAQSPAGTGVVRLLTLPGYADPASGTEPWPTRDENPAGFEFGGYSLDENSLPTFRYEVWGINVTEFSSFSNSGEHRTLIREITYTVDGDVPENRHLALAAGPKIRALAEGFRLDDLVTMTVASDGGLQAVERKARAHLIVVPLTLKKGTTTLTVTYTWN